MKGYLAAAVAFISCPCHFPLTLPLLLSLTAGTAFGAWLASHVLAFALASTVLFLAGLWLAFRWLGRGRAGTAAVREGVARVTLITSSHCSSCEEAREVWHELSRRHRFRWEEIDIASRRGRALAARQNVFTTPTTLIDGRVAFRGVPRPDQAAAAVKR